MPNIVIRVLADTAGATKDLDAVGVKTGGVGQAMSGLQAPAAIAAGAIGGLLAVAAKAGSDADQAAGGLAAVFGTYADQVTAQANQASRMVGLSKTEYSSLATVIGAQLKNMGLPMDDVAGKTEGLVSLGADLAATYGGTTSDAVSALSSLLRGETDPIERYGVSIKAADVSAQKAAMGLDGLTGAADKQATATATLALLSAQTGDAVGQFGREADSAAGSAQIAAASAQDAAAQLGTALQPAMTAAAQAATAAATALSEHSTAALIIIGVIGTLAAVVLGYNAVMAALPAIQAAAAAAQWLWNAAVTANPIGLLIVAIAAVIAIVVLMIRHWDDIARVAGVVWDAVTAAVRKAADTIGSVLTRAWDLVTAGFSWYKASMLAGFQAIGGWLSDLGGHIWSALTAPWRLAQAAGEAFVGAIRSGLQWVITTAQQVADKLSWIKSLASSVSGAVSAVKGWFSWDGDQVGGWETTSTLTLAAGDPTGLSWLPGGGRQSITVDRSTHITVDGALDARAVARQIRDILNGDARLAGRVALNGAVI